MGCSGSSGKQPRNVGSYMKALPTEAVVAAAAEAYERGERYIIKASQLILRNERKVHDVYTLDAKPLGEGAFGKVLRALHRKTKQVRAIKIVSKAKPKQHDILLREINIMKALDHPHCIKLFETFEDGRATYLSMEFCPGGELLQRVLGAGHFSEADAIGTTTKILKGVNYLHRKCIAHRDLKPENVLIMSKEDPLATSSLKLVDFGLSVQFTPGEIFTHCVGTVYYMAPQVVNQKYNHLCDIWAVGAMDFLLLSGRPPFSGKNDKEVFHKIRLGAYTTTGSEWSHISDGCKGFIRQLLCSDQDERCSAQKALEHEWLQDDRAEMTPSRRPDVPIVTNLRAFHNQNRFQKAAVQLIGRHSDEKKLLGLKKVFESLDHNQDGTVTQRELEKGLNESGLVSEGLGAAYMLEAADMDCSGTIDYSEFLAAAMDHSKQISKAACWSAFCVFDRDGSGRITLAELRMMLDTGAVQEAIGSDCCETMLKECDKSGDGEIDFEEFVEMVGASFKGCDCFISETQSFTSRKGSPRSNAASPSGSLSELQEIPEIPREGLGDLSAELLKRSRRVVTASSTVTMGLSVA